MQLISKYQNSNGKLITLPKETQRVLDIQSKQPLAPNGDKWLIGSLAGIRNSIGGLIGNVARRIIFNKQKKDYYLLRQAFEKTQQNGGNWLTHPGAFEKTPRLSSIPTPKWARVADIVNPLFQKGGQLIPKRQNPSTPIEYYKFLETLPRNQRLTPESEYHTYRYWQLHNKPKNFKEGINRGMYKMQPDGFWHAQSIAFNQKTGNYEGMKPLTHETLDFEINGTIGSDFQKQYIPVTRDNQEWKYIPKQNFNISKDQVILPMITVTPNGNYFRK